VRIAVLGIGAVGARAARQLASSEQVTKLTLADVAPGRAEGAARSIADEGRTVAAASVERWSEGAEVGVIASPAGDHRRHAERLLEQGAHVVSTSDDVDEVIALLDLDAEARTRGLSVVIGAGFAPGLTDVLAAHAATTFDTVEEVHVAKVGTAGPACARAHHSALTGEAHDWRNGAWQTRRAGSGRELCWFPDPVGGQDCYRAGLPDARLLLGAFPDAERITARMGATRRDRLTSGLPMLRKPHPEGTIGAVRVELRGRRGQALEVSVLGAMDRPGVAAGCVAAVAALRVGEGDVERRGVRAATFDGVPA
jgi:saccharopine dehydrogenase-like NADP-dependent oxidoreductase